ncbi:hypothetical protein ABT203_25850 [Streptomyces sp900105245]
MDLLRVCSAISGRH